MPTMFDNPITQAISLIDSQLADAEPAVRSAIEAVADIDIATLFMLNEVRALAFAEQRITLDVANTLHAIGSRFRSATLAERFIFVTFTVELAR